ncbi:MAG: HD domain-containing protein [Bacteroidales bacterium]|nr:HD domain-containing protein [Bacteroidales bacterium]
MEKHITLAEIKSSSEIISYIKQADASLKVMGYTEHGLAHVGIVSKIAGDLLHDLGYSEHIVELARIAGYMHDIGNVVNRIDHAQSGAIMAFRILDNMGMPADDIALIINAIGNHDESTAVPLNEVSAALILADKTDVRRSRVRNKKFDQFDIHERVNYAVIENNTFLDKASMTFNQNITIDTEIGSIMEYFEIYMNRLLLARRAAEFLKLHFMLTVNGTKF